MIGLYSVSPQTPLAMIGKEQYSPCWTKVYQIFFLLFFFFFYIIMWTLDVIFCFCFTLTLYRRRIIFDDISINILFIQQTFLFSQNGFLLVDDEQINNWLNNNKDICMVKWINVCLVSVFSDHLAGSTPTHPICCQGIGRTWGACFNSPKLQTKLTLDKQQSLSNKSKLVLENISSNFFFSPNLSACLPGKENMVASLGLKKTRN